MKQLKELKMNLNHRICPFFKECGACAFQDIPFEEYLSKKKEKTLSFLKEAEICPKEVEFISILPETRRRVNFAFFKSHMGYNQFHSHKIVDITECLLLKKELQELICPLRELLSFFNSKGDVYLLLLKEGIDILVKEKGKEKTKLLFEHLEKITAFAQKFKLARFQFNNDILYQITNESLSSIQFLQPSKEGEEALQKAVLDGVSSLNKKAKVLDLFSGSGTFTIPLQQAGFKVKGVDSNGEALRRLEAFQIPYEERDLFNFPLNSEELSQFDALVLDPPRAGAFNQVKEILQSSVSNVVMVSCSLKTFKKDARKLLEEFSLERLVLVDQFVYSSHVELVASFKRK
ncbi:MAG: hypothetical protein PHI50_00995 [Alphaproteobacteria bacterium]|nr:hypothetical protein [Alphaproteobacteria bacterium]